MGDETTALRSGAPTGGAHTGGAARRLVSPGGDGR